MPKQSKPKSLYKQDDRTSFKSRLSDKIIVDFGFWRVLIVFSGLFVVFVPFLKRHIYVFFIIGLFFIFLIFIFLLRFFMKTLDLNGRFYNPENVRFQRSIDWDGWYREW